MSKWSAPCRVRGPEANAVLSPERRLTCENPTKRPVFTTFSSCHLTPLLCLATLGGLFLLQLSSNKVAWAWTKSAWTGGHGSLPPVGGWSNGTWSEKAEKEFRDGLRSCNATAEETLRQYFRDIVLIVNNNYEKHTGNTTAFWLKLYGRFFNHIVFISAVGVPSLGIEPAADFYPDAPDPWWGTWMYHFWALKKIILRYPQAAGFLWTNDDVIINYWNIVGADKTKLWLPNHPQKYEYQTFPLNPSKELAEKIKGNWASRSQFRKQVKLALSLLDPRYKEQFAASMLPEKDAYLKRGCDLFYIPARYGPPVVQDVLPALQGAQLVSELAIPLMFFSLDDPRNFSPVLNDMVYRWDMWLGGGGPFVPQKHWKANISAFHPWKISLGAAKRDLISFMSQGDRCLPKHLSDFL